MALFMLKLLIHILYSFLILAKDVFMWLQWHAQIEFFLKLIIRVRNGLFDAQMKPLKLIEHVQIEFFILIIRVSHVRSIGV